MKTLTTAICLTIGVCALAQSAAPASVPTLDRAAIQAKVAGMAKVAATSKTNKMTRAEMENRPQVLRKTGGFLDVPSTGLAILVIDCRAKPGAASEQFQEVFARLSKTNVKVLKQSPASGQSTLAFANEMAKKDNAVFTLLIDEDELRDGLAVYPESRIALINAKKYQGGSDPVQPEIRIIKQLWRSLGFVSGIGYAPFKNDVFQPVFSMAELDALEYQVMQPMNFQKMYQTMAQFGVKRARHIPYRLAVREGWAAAPTNEYQRAVWEEVRSDKERGPAKAITIPPPQKK